jgi:hypothetical protein
MRSPSATAGITPACRRSVAVISGPSHPHQQQQHHAITMPVSQCPAQVRTASHLHSLQDAGNRAQCRPAVSRCTGSHKSIQCATLLRLARPEKRLLADCTHPPAPMLQMVAIPVQLMWSTPSPKYSTMAPVPPFTVRMPATCTKHDKTIKFTTAAIYQCHICGNEFTHGSTSSHAQHHLFSWSSLSTRLTQPHDGSTVNRSSHCPLTHSLLHHA